MQQLQPGPGLTPSQHRSSPYLVGLVGIIMGVLHALLDFWLWHLRAFGIPSMRGQEKGTVQLPFLGNQQGSYLCEASSITIFQRPWNTRYNWPRLMKMSIDSKSCWQAWLSLLVWIINRNNKIGIAKRSGKFLFLPLRPFALSFVRLVHAQPSGWHPVIFLDRNTQQQW